MKIPEEIKKCVVYLGIEIENNGVKSIKYRGTGFFVGMASKTLPDVHFAYLVTARHVAEKLESRIFYIRVNTREGKSEDLRANGAELKWRRHPTDNSADVALIPMGLDVNRHDFLMIPTSMAMTNDIRLKHEIGAGDEIFITGLFVHHAGMAKNLPIIRTGNIAMIPDEKIPIKNFGNMDAYLIEGRSIGGLSGSPVFVVNTTPNQRNFFLMGLIHGHWSVDFEQIIDDVEEDNGVKAGVNVGVAIVTPASKILDVINAGETINERESFEAMEIAKRSQKI
jgi:hypothetical protein